MSDIKWSGIVEKDFRGLSDEPLVSAGERVYGYLNYYEETPYILGEIIEVDTEYVAVAHWYPVAPESIEVELFGVKISLDRLRELVKADTDGRVPKLGIGSKVYTLGGRFAYAIGEIAECTVSMVSMSKKDMKWRYRCRQPRVDHETDSWQDEFFEDQIGTKYFLTKPYAERALASAGEGAK